MRTNRLPSLLAAAAATLVLAGCGWKSDGVARLNELYPPPPAVPVDPCGLPDDPDAPAVGDPGGACTGLTEGRWAARMVQFGTMSPMSAPWNLKLTDLFLAEPSADGKALELTFCDQVSALSKEDGSPLDLGRTEMPEATRQAIGEVKLALPLPGDGTFAVPDVAWLWGVQPGSLANPLTDALPTAEDDPRVWDQDADGHPGVTVHVLNPFGDRYMARRSRWTLGQARIAPEAGWLVGSMTFEITENALGASNDLLLTVAPITPNGQCAASTYQMRCVGAGYTCAQLVADHAALFRDAPE